MIIEKDSDYYGIQFDRFAAGFIIWLVGVGCGYAWAYYHFVISVVKP